MTFEYKYVTIKGKIFLIKLLTSIEERQLKNSNGRIAMSVFYFPNFPISMKESELEIKKKSSDLINEMMIIVNEYQSFYKLFKPETSFMQIGSSGGINIYGEIIAENSKALLFLNLKEIS